LALSLLLLCYLSSPRSAPPPDLRSFPTRRSSDLKVRRQSTDKYDLFYGHIGAMDTMALALKIAARMIEDGELDKRIAQRYSGWNSELGQQILKGQMSLADLAKYAQEHNLSPVHQSGRQEQLENLVNHYLFDK